MKTSTRPNAVWLPAGAPPTWTGSASLDERRRALLREGESLKAVKNSVSEEIGKVKDKSQVQDKILEMREVSNRIKVLDEELKQVDDELSGVLMTVPNLPDPSHAAGNLGKRQRGGQELGRAAAVRFSGQAPLGDRRGAGHP